MSASVDLVPKSVDGPSISNNRRIEVRAAYLEIKRISIDRTPALLSNLLGAANVPIGHPMERFYFRDTPEVRDALMIQEVEDADRNAAA